MLTMNAPHMKRITSNETMKHTITLLSSLLLAPLAGLSLSAQAAITPVPYVVPAVVDDLQEAQVADRVQLSGMLGARIHANTTTRLLETVDVNRLLGTTASGLTTWVGMGSILASGSMPLRWPGPTVEIGRAHV